MKTPLDGQVALVTGASRGVGRGIAVGLAEAGATVYATGRSVASTTLPSGVTPMVCDHSDDSAVARTFERLAQEAGRLDILANSAWAGYERMIEDGQFTWPAPFWEQPLWRWEAMLGIGVRAAFVASQHAAKMMVPMDRGLIVNVSYWAAQKYVGNAIYGVAKAATDKLTADCAHDLRDHGVTVVSLYPGLVRTEAVLAAGVFDLSNSESPEFLGRVVGALAADPQRFARSGTVVIAAAAAEEYGLTDTDGRRPVPLSVDEA